MATKHIFIVVALLTSACGKRDNVACAQDSNCDLAIGGVCTAGGSDRWCAYPDQACTSGYRYSTQAVGDSLSGDCVVEPDAGIDNLPDWVVGHGGPGDDYGLNIAETPNGDLVMVGTLSGTISLGGSALTGGPGWVARYRPDGSHLWSKIVGDGARADAVAVDRQDNIYVLGTIANSADFGGGVRSGRAFYMVKLDGNDGHYLWDRTHPVDPLTGYVEVFDIKSIGDSIAICGDFQDADLGNGLLHSEFGRDYAVAVYDEATGAYKWQRALKTTDEESGPCSIVGVDNDVIVTGGAVGNAMLGGDPIPAKGTGYTVLARYRGADGAHVWSMGLGGADHGAVCEPSLLVTDGTRLFVGGGFFGGSCNLGGADLPSPATGAGYLAAFDATDGAHLWSESLGESVQTLAADGTRLTVAITFHGTTTIGSISLSAVGSNEDYALVGIDPKTGLPGVEITDFGGTTNGATLSLRQLIDAHGRLAGIGDTTNSAKLKGITATSNGGRDIIAFRVAFWWRERVAW